jgi:hypothetical protein
MRQVQLDLASLTSSLRIEKSQRERTGSESPLRSPYFLETQSDEIAYKYGLWVSRRCTARNMLRTLGRPSVRE